VSAGARARYPDLAGLSVFVSGGGSGIGAALVACFARAGCRVTFVDVDDAASAALIDSLRALHGVAPVRHLRCDVRDIASLQSAIADASAAHGSIRVLVNNAARDDRHDFADMTPELWDDLLAVNLRHHFFAAQAVAPAMEAAGGGSIINLGSVSWMRGRTRLSAYTAAKAAIHGLTRTLARELGPRGIRVNALVPGAIATARQQALWVTPADEAAIVDAQCLKFRLSEDDVARTALFLASNESRGITGQNLIVDAGLAQTSAIA
jgi:NAD(P)-dependent dehydrogenase (short-subunit alcohol dehydrogenase family)